MWSPAALAQSWSPLWEHPCLYLCPHVGTQGAERLLDTCPAPTPSCFEDKRNKDFTFTALLYLGPRGFETEGGAAT